MRQLIVFICITSIYACSAPAPSNISTQTSKVVNGTIDTGHPAVGMLVAGDSGACTATLIAPNKLLTAAHCVLTETSPYQYVQPINFYLDGFYGKAYRASAVEAHPSYSGGNYSDVAVVWLSESITSVQPMPIATTNEYPKVNDTITLIGYGLTEDPNEQYGTKRKATTVISDVYSEIFAYDGMNGSEPTICNGDSGGPTTAILNGVETVIGVHSTGDQGCVDHGYDMRVDVMYQWITTQQVTQKIYGGVCVSGSDCVSGLCIGGNDGSGLSYCTQSCDTTTCPWGDECVPVSGASNISNACMPHTGGQTPIGDPCEENMDCQTGVCISISENNNICSQRCDLTLNDCPESYDCLDSSIGGLCIPEGLVGPLQKENGESCVDHPQCKSGICALVGTTRKCVKACSGPSECESTEECSLIAGINATGCVPIDMNKKELGDSCTDSLECQSNLCAQVGDDKICISLCDPQQSAPCPTGFYCLETSTANQGACVPENKKGIGQACTDSSQCDSDICATIGDEKYCTQQCDESSNPCPANFNCVTTGNTAVCIKSDESSSGGCSIHNPSSALGLYLLLFALLALYRIRTQEG